MISLTCLTFAIELKASRTYDWVKDRGKGCLWFSDLGDDWAADYQSHISFISLSILQNLINNHCKQYISLSSNLPYNTVAVKNCLTSRVSHVLASVAFHSSGVVLKFALFNLARNRKKLNLIAKPILNQLHLGISFNDFLFVRSRVVVDWIGLTLNCNFPVQVLLSLALFKRR